MKFTSFIASMQIHQSVSLSNICRDGRESRGFNPPSHWAAGGRSVQACLHEQTEFQNHHLQYLEDKVCFSAVSWWFVYSGSVFVFQACAPLYQWSTFGVSEREPVGTCYLKKGGTVVEYSPCRSSLFFPSLCPALLFFLELIKQY